MPLLLAIFAALAPLVFLKGLLDPANLPQSAFVEVGALGLLTLWLSSRRPARLAVLTAAPFSMPLLALLAWSGASVLWARNGFEWASTWLHWAACSVVYVLVVVGVRRERDARWLLGGLVGSGLAVAVLGLLQHLVGLRWIPQAFPPAATFVNRNVAAVYVVMTLPLAAGFLLSARTPRARWLLAPATGLLGAFVFYTFTKAAWMAVAVEGLLGLAIFLAVRPSPGGGPAPPRQRVPALLCAVAIFGALVGLPRPQGRWGPSDAYEHVARTWRLACASSAGGTDADEARVNSFRVRRAIWLNTLEMAKDSPIRGVGLGNHKVHYPRYARRAVVDELFGATAQLDHVHNEYLQVAAELGLVGVGLMAWLGLVLLRTWARVLRGSCDGPEAWLVVGVILSCVGLLVDGAFSFPLRQAIPPLVLMIHLGLLSGVFRRQAEQPPAADAPDTPTGTAGRRLVLAGSLIALGITGWLCTRWIASDRRCFRMMAAERRKDWVGVLSEAREGHTLNPRRREPLFLGATASLALRDPPGAIAALSALLQGYPNDMNALGNLGLAYGAAGDTRRALECYERVLVLKPDDPLALFKRGTLFERDRDLPRALDAYRLAARFDPRSAEYEYRRGVAALRLRGNEEAEQALRRSLELRPDFAPGHKALGVLLFEILGRKAEGARHLERALDLDPGLSDAERIRQMLGAERRTGFVDKGLRRDE